MDGRSVDVVVVVVVVVAIVVEVVGEETLCR